MSVPATCLLCGVADETTEHIYLSCSYSKSVWDSFFTQENTSQAVHHSTPLGKMRTICKLTVQAVLYAIWNERNKRLYTSVARHLTLLPRRFKSFWKPNRMHGMDQDVRNSNRFTSNRSSTGDTFLHLWFQNIPT